MREPLWAHQASALDAAVKSGFQSGTHAHATGTGKSRLGKAIMAAYARANPGKLVLWVCEQGGVISQILCDGDIPQGFIVCDLVKNKNSDWTSAVGSALCWRRPVVVAVNRAFLVSQTRYLGLAKVPLGLVIHDECHSGTGRTMQDFYAWLQSSHPSVSVIGLSATPPGAKAAAHPALARIASRYSIYDAVRGGTIVPLRMYWLGSHAAKHRVHKPERAAAFVREISRREQMNKIIVWCGTIKNCQDAARIWSRVFNDGKESWLVSLDTSAPREEGAVWSDYQAFKRHPGPSLLFCAAKHREGSDIPGLSMGVFMDGVAKRGAAVFVQCAGRVLRKCPGKSHGVIVDLKASSGLNLCDRVGGFLQLPPGVMPWTSSHLDTDLGAVSSLTLSCASPALPFRPCTDLASVDESPSLRTLFRRPIPADPRYETRVEEELALMEGKGLAKHLIRALEVLDLAGNDLPHVTRGSCGSSLVCFLLGISHVDPVRHGICFARFMNEFRENLPDIDFDFPYNRRSEIFLRMALKWPGEIARISNHVHFHEKSALREVLRRRGLKVPPGCDELRAYVRSLTRRERAQVSDEVANLEGSFRCYSLHCGGVVYYPGGVPKEDILEGKEGGLLAQVRDDKRDVARDGRFKIDVLSSRALAQLLDTHAEAECGPLVMEEPPFSTEMADLFARGDTVGLTLAESPLARAEFIKRKPVCVADVAACMARIRPAARQGKGDIVFDDDAIRIISEALECTHAEADQVRRKLAKGDASAMPELRRRLGSEAAASLREELGSLSLYGFCRAHAMSYAQLVCWLAWVKIKRPKAFWRAALNHCQSGYRPWVHMWEAHKAGVDPFDEDLPKNDMSVFGRPRASRVQGETTLVGQLRENWFWDVRRGFIPGCYLKTSDVGLVTFRGVIASSRRLSKGRVALCVGVAGAYTEVVVSDRGFSAASRMATGSFTLEGDDPPRCQFA